MKAIDFACRLLRRLEESELAPLHQRILIALGAGLETCQDIAAHCVVNSQQTAAQLTQLERKGYIKSNHKERPYSYFLEKEGRKQLFELFDFLPHKPTHEEETFKH